MVTRVPYTAGNLTKSAWGIDDVLVGTTDAVNVFIGDAGGSILNHALGGNDQFTAKATPGGISPFITNTFYGDAYQDIFDFGQGGNDSFQGAAFSGNFFFGDAGGSMMKAPGPPITQSS